MSQPKPLPIWDRSARKLVEEWMDDHPTTYETKPTRSLMEWMQSFRLYDKAYALTQRRRGSAKKIQPFVEKYKIDMSEFEQKEYKSFDDWFVREFRPGVRHFPRKVGEMGAVCEARYFAWEKVDPKQRFPIKGHALDAAQLMGSEERAKPFIGGPVILVRLAPMDYHRVHFPDNGKMVERLTLGRRLWTVSWKAVRNKEDIYLKNEREIQILDTKHFGRLAMIEIGALTIGRIVQTHKPGTPFERGDQKALFRYGGSAVAIFGEPGAWRPSDDLIEQTKSGVETFVRLGEVVATRTKE
jgi:phosphatidylserine decarboxylase